MKNIKSFKIMISSILATTIIGAGAIKAAQDSNAYVEYSMNNYAREENGDGSTTTGEFKPTKKMNQTVEETKAVNDLW